MAHIAVIQPPASLGPGHVLDAVGVSDGVRSALASPPGYALQLFTVTMERGAEMTWSHGHGDEGVYVVSGQVSVDGRVAPDGGAVVVESGVAATLVADASARLVHVRSVDPPSDARGVCVHVVGPAGWAASGADSGIDARWFADSTCPTCDIALLRVRHDGPNRKLRAHSHSQDEIIHILDGSIVLGSRVLGPGASLCIPADVRYAFVGGPNGYAYLNYRAAASFMTFEPHSPPVPEGGLALHGRIVGDVR